MPSDEQMREAIIEAYHSHPHWVEKVAAMSEKQVAAVYLRLLDQKKL